MKRLILAVCLLAIFSQPVFAEEKQQFRTVLMNKEDKAPFKGFLVDESQFVRLLDAQLKAKRLELELEIKEKMYLRIEDEYAQKLLLATEKPKWYQTTAFHRGLGIAIGVATTTAIVYAVSEMR